MHFNLNIVARNQMRQEGLGDRQDIRRSPSAVAEREAIRLIKHKLKLEAQKSLRA